MSFRKYIRHEKSVALPQSNLCIFCSHQISNLNLFTNDWNMKMLMSFLVILLICTVHSKPAKNFPPEALSGREVRAAHLGYVLGLKSEQKRSGMATSSGFVQHLMAQKGNGGFNNGPTYHSLFDQIQGSWLTSFHQKRTNIIGKTPHGEQINVIGLNINTFLSLLLSIKCV